MNYQKYLGLLKEAVAYKSISTDAVYQPEVEKMVSFLENLYKTHGFTVTVARGYDNPIIIASYVVSPEAKTVLIYGHYDIQPADISDGWETDPYGLTEKEGRIYGRGAVDNKGQFMIHTATVFDLIEAGKLKYNVKFMIEGNEETGSPHITQFMHDYAETLKSDFALISDGEITAGIPTLETGFRGGFNSTTTVVTSTTDLHSGLFGGAVPMASLVLSEMLGKLFVNGKVTIPGFYDDVLEIAPEDIENNRRIPFTLEEYKNLSGAKELTSLDGYDFYTQVGLRPAVVITGMQSGYVGEGYRNSVPSKAVAKINFRLVKNQNPEELAKKFAEYMKQLAPSYADVTVEYSDPYDGIKLNTNNEYVEKARGILAEVYGTEPIFKYCGGGLPIVTLIDDIFKIPQVLLPLANEDCRMHAVGENYRVDLIEKGLRFSEAFLGE
ncbi:MAG: M20/M25/M40 family metallo-hydrolase [Patescibacteria group bacterium]